MRENNPPSHDRQDDMYCKDKYSEWKSLFRDMMKEFETMWDLQLGQVTATKHRTDLIEPGKTPIPESPYLAGPQNRRLEKTENDKMMA